MKAVVLGAAAGGGSLSPAGASDGVFAALIGLPALASAWKRTWPG
jgi:hypothetical protein